ncbi:hypothetical protein GLI01_36460 [Gluconacetobacter liquefaciens]|nr:hypothetical protein AA0522_0142 [Gluconacetobacter liquefaciens NRIC 0522]GEB39611.1 hypothetical protein GLI01_36460 [Gluconacetobacter liquefaciens]
MAARDLAQAEIERCAAIFYATGQITVPDTSIIQAAKREDMQMVASRILKNILK